MSQSWDSVASMHDHVLTVHSSCADRLIDNASLAVAMARGIKGTLPCAHGPTVLTNPEPSSASAARS